MVLSNQTYESNWLPPRQGKGSKPAWTDAEEELLERFYPSIPAREIGKKLYRTKRSVENKAWKMGLRKSHERLREMGRQNIDLRWG